MDKHTRTPLGNYVGGFLVFGPMIAPILGGQKKVGILAWLATVAAVIGMYAIGANGNDEDLPTILLIGGLSLMIQTAAFFFWLGDCLARRKAAHAAQTAALISVSPEDGMGAHS